MSCDFLYIVFETTTTWFAQLSDLSSLMPLVNVS